MNKLIIGIIGAYVIIGFIISILILADLKKKALHHVKFYFIWLVWLPLILEEPYKRLRQRVNPPQNKYKRKKKHG